MSRPSLRLHPSILPGLLFFWTAGSVLSQAPGKAAPPAREAAPLASCVWKVAGKKQNTVYLAGSVHLLRERDLPLPPAFQAAYEDSHRLVFELDMHKTEDLAEMARIQALARLGDGKSLQDLLTRKTWKLLRRYIEKNRLERLGLERMKPGFVYLTISSLETMKLGARPDLGLEQQFFRKSKKDAKPTSGLETMEFQLNLFDELTDEALDQLLREGLSSIDQVGDSIDEMITAWKAGDADALDELLSEQFEDLEGLRELILEKRNRNWIPEVERALESGENVMFLVGAGHLVGDDSVVAMLREKGIRAEQLAYDSLEAAPKKEAH